MPIADPSQASEIGFQQNPLAGATQATLGGADWAQGQAKVDLARQSLQMQQKQHDEMKRQFNVGVGKDFMGMVQDATSEPSAKVRKSKIDQIKAWQEQSGAFTVDPAVYAAMDDEKDYIPKFQKLFKGMGATDPQALEDYYSGLVQQGHISGKDLSGQIEKTVNGLAMIQAGQARASGFNNRVEEQSQVNAQGQANKVLTQFQPRLEGAARIQDIWQKVDSGKVKNNGALKSLILSEIQRLETGASNPAFEAQEQKEMKSRAEQLNNIIPSITGNQTDSVPAGVTKQLKALSSTLTSSYMDQADSAFSILKAGARPDQKDIFAQKHQAMQDTYRKRFGYWGNEAPDDTSAPAAPKKNQNQGSPDEMLQKAMILRQGYNNETDPTKKARILMRAKQALDDNTFGKAFNGAN